jgi:hypothetical protein
MALGASAPPGEDSTKAVGRSAPQNRPGPCPGFRSARRWRQTGGEIAAFVHCVGTAASLRGVASVLKRYKPCLKIYAVEPAESSVLKGGQPGPHKIEGVGIGTIPPLWDPTLVDDILAVKTDDAKDMARRLARKRLFRRDLVRRTLCRDPGGTLARPDARGCYADGRFRPQVSEHRCLPKKMTSWLDPGQPKHVLPQAGALGWQRR